MLLEKLRPALEQLKGRHNLVGVEIGVYRGKHASNYLKKLDIKCVFLIDPYMEYENYDSKKLGLKKNLEVVKREACAELRKREQKIKWVRKKSVDAANLIAANSLDFVYVDGNHSYDSVTQDILLYYPKLKRGGLLSGHDYDIGSVRKAVDNFAKIRGLDLHIKNTGELKGKKKYDWWIWKE